MTFLKSNRRSGTATKPTSCHSGQCQGKSSEKETTRTTAPRNSSSGRTSPWYPSCPGCRWIHEAELRGAVIFQ